MEEKHDIPGYLWITSIVIMLTAVAMMIFFRQYALIITFLCAASTAFAVHFSENYGTSRFIGILWLFNTIMWILIYFK